MSPASAAGHGHRLTAEREAEGEGRPMTMAYPHDPRPVYNSGTSAASCSEASPNGIPVQLGQ